MCLSNSTFFFVPRYTQDPAADDKKKEGAPEKNGGAPSKKDADASQPHVHAE